MDVCSEGILTIYYVTMIFNTLSTYRNIIVTEVERERTEIQICGLLEKKMTEVQ